MSAMSAMSELNGCPSLMSVDSKQGRQIRGGANKRVYLEQWGAEEHSSKAISVTTVFESMVMDGDVVVVMMTVVSAVAIVVAVVVVVESWLRLW